MHEAEACTGILILYFSATCIQMISSAALSAGAHYDSKECVVESDARKWQRAAIQPVERAMRQMRADVENIDMLIFLQDVAI